MKLKLAMESGVPHGRVMKQNSDRHLVLLTKNKREGTHTAGARNKSRIRVTDLRGISPLNDSPVNPAEQLGK